MAEFDEKVCYIKKEYLVAHVDENKSQEVGAGRDDNKRKHEEEEPRNKQKKRGINKNRPLFKQEISAKLCRSLLDGEQNSKCQYEQCRWSHDLEEFVKNRPEDIGDTCFIYSTKGFCKFGITCRFGKAHLDEKFLNIGKSPDDSSPVEKSIDMDALGLLRKKKYNFEKSDKIIAKLQGSVSDEDQVSLTEREKKTPNFRDKLYLSPLTTVGNLPFRRICKEFGADITCGEMACSLPLINGHQSEWALTKRHESEDLFGIQICGHSEKLTGYSVQVLAEQANFDFVDLNVGCPIDLIFRQGAGSALMRRPQVLEKIVRSCSSILASYDKVFTVKIRTGVYENKSVAHELVPKLEEWGAKLVTLHGRSREQRYTKLADYEYIEKCASSVKDIPLFGNGDILSFEDFADAKKRAPSISGVMIGRGALIKPWIFREIKEQKPWDPSSSERFDIVKKFVNYGLDHWGSDTKGVENTRRFLLEWQSFLYRYVPYGLLERPPQKINQRPDNFRGRDDLETLMASPASRDWIKLSEMLLGRVPDGFQFLPKHRANAY